LSIKTIAMIHTVPGAAANFEKLVRERIGNLKIIHTEDGAVREVMLKNGGLNSQVYKRVIEDMIVSEQAGAELILVTCSSISPCVDLAPHFVSIPVLKVDEPMIRRAIQTGTRIVVAATAKTTLKPTVDQLDTLSAEMGKKIKVKTLLCEEAYPFLISGDMETYHKMIAEALLKVMRSCDVILLAQASMTGSIQLIKPEKMKVPILSSPELAVENLKNTYFKSPGKGTRKGSKKGSKKG